MPETSDDLIRQLLSVLRETLEGPSGTGSYFTDARSDAGLFGALATLSAAAASRSLSGTTIAAHAHHVAFGMADACRCLGGDRTPQDWRQSWRVARVDEEEWRRLQERLRSEYARLGAAVAAHAGASQEALGDALGVLAHLAYHLGAIQQKRAALRELSGER